jgi:adenosylcobinamide-phosphate synthase
VNGANAVGLVAGHPLLGDPRPFHPVAGFGAAAVLGQRVTRAALTAMTTRAMLGARTLRHQPAVMAGVGEATDLPGARQRLSHLCGPSPSTLDSPELARPTVESVVENTSDAVVAPLFWGATAGLTGLLGYRAANTLDATVRHRSARYARFGTAATISRSCVRQGRASRTPPDQREIDGGEGRRSRRRARWWR